MDNTEIFCDFVCNLAKLNKKPEKVKPIKKIKQIRIPKIAKEKRIKMSDEEFKIRQKKFKHIWYLKNKELVYARYKKWKQDNPEISKQYYKSYNKEYYKHNINYFKERRKRKKQ